MKRIRIVIFIIALAALCLLTLGCSSGQTSQERVESGVINKEYIGIPTAPVMQAYKLDEQAKENMIKITIKCGVEKEIPVGGSEQQTDKAGETDDAKPKI